MLARCRPGVMDEAPPFHHDVKATRVQRPRRLA